MSLARIALVDDEPALLKLMQIYLTRMQFMVCAYNSATSAWEAFAAAPADVDIFVVDLGLPDLPGEQLGIRIVRANRAVKVLICSGFPFEVATLPEDVQPHFTSILKPFVPQALADEIRRLRQRAL